MAEQSHQYSKTQWTVLFNGWTVMVYELFINKAVQKH